MTKDMKRFKNVISENGTLKQWPSKSLLKQMALIYIWSKLDQDRPSTKDLLDSTVTNHGICNSIKTVIISISCEPLWK